MDYSNISSMLSQLKGQAAYTGKPQNLSAITEKQAVELLLKEMEPGQIFAGEISDIRGSYITITLQNMQTLQARLTENFEFVIGQKSLFQVKDNQDNQLFIRPLAMDTVQNGELMMAERALTAAGIQITEKTLDLVKNLMAANQPIDKQSILSYVRQMAKFPQTEISDLISLHKYQIPVNEENLNQFSNYKQFEHSLLKDIGSMEQGLPTLVETLADEALPKAQIFLKEFIDIMMPRSEQPEVEEKQTASEENSAVVSKNAAGAETLEEQPKQGMPKTEATSLERLSNLIKEPDFMEGKKGKQEVRELLRGSLEEVFMLKPEETADKEKVKEYYKGLKEKCDGLRELFQSVGKEAVQLDKSMQNMSENVRFMEALNEAFTYIQLPLKLANEQAHGDLYVYTKKKTVRNEQEGVSAFLHLDMEHLGAVDVLVRLTEQRVATNFTLETEELLDFIEQHMELLTQRLEKKGYSCSTQIMMKSSEEPEAGFEQLLTGVAATGSEMKRFSFDVRA